VCNLRSRPFFLNRPIRRRERQQAMPVPALTASIDLTVQIKDLSRNRVSRYAALRLNH
jgi:hypothetical protein